MNRIVLLLLVSTNLVFSQIQKNEFIYEKAPFPSCHASTIAESRSGLVSAWFGGSHEKNPDVGIWVSRLENEKWTTPIEVANGVQSESKRFPTWNPVLFQIPNENLLLFYKVGPSPSEWWGMLIESADGGKTWSKPQKLPEGIYGPIKNKPILIENTLLCPTSSEDKGWRVHYEMFDLKSKKWSKIEPINDGKVIGAIQPTVFVLPNKDLVQFCRSTNGFIVESVSKDNGKTWTALQTNTLPNPSSGIDGITLKNGKHLLVYNPNQKGKYDRTPLVVGISDDTKNWKEFVVLENEPKAEFSYPAIIQSADGKVHITYTWKRQKIKYVTLDL